MWPKDILALGEPVVAPRLYDLGDSLTAWAAGVLDIAGEGPLMLVGNSIGGSCALEVAWLAPERVTAIVLIGAKASHRPEPDLRDAAVRVLAEQGMAAAWSVYWEPLFGPRADPAVIATARRIAFGQPIDDVIRGVHVFHSRPDRSAFAQIWPRPLVVISGEHDRTPRNGAAFAASVPNGEFHLIKDAGHYVTFEQPQLLATILRQTTSRLADDS
jgi:2-succinyl-5-enolpyruvyl-6-hydroxy-3-cyclohexene-1-carboxylate synthase